MILALLLALQDPPKTVTFQQIKETRRGIVEGHVKSVPKALEPLVDTWVTMSGFPVLSEDGQSIREVLIAENQFDPKRQYGTPPDVFNSVSVQFRKIPAKLRETKFLIVSGRLRFLKAGAIEGGREKLKKLWHLTEAVEGAVPNPDAAGSATPREGTLNFALLETASSQGGELRIPEPVKALDGKWVTLTGHVLLSWSSDEITTFQLAKNPWDGCCMGVPPGYFNAVRVTMAEGKRYSSKFDRVATMSGRFKVDVRKTGNGYIDGVYWLEQAVEGAVPSPDKPESPKEGSFPYVPVIGVVTLAAGAAFLALRKKT